MLGTRKRDVGGRLRPKRWSVDEEDIAAADAGTTRNKLRTRLQKSERVCGESGRESAEVCVPFEDNRVSLSARGKEEGRRRSKALQEEGHDL